MTTQTVRLDDETVLRLAIAIEEVRARRTASVSELRREVASYRHRDRLAIHRQIVTRLLPDQVAS